jgi:DNA-binding PadR family transcriptional regulator
MICRLVNATAERAIRSTVPWLVLGLLIEKPSYGYEVYRRFERRYDDLLPSRGTTRIYSALESLERARLIEPIDAPPASGTPRQPKVHYRATARGAAEWKRELVERIDEDTQRSAVLSSVLVAAAVDDTLLNAVLDRLERHLLDQPGLLEQPGEGESVAFGVELVNEYQRVVRHAQFMFLEWARARVNARAGGGGGDGPTVA